MCLLSRHQPNGFYKLYSFAEEACSTCYAGYRDFDCVFDHSADYSNIAGRAVFDCCAGLGITGALGDNRVIQDIVMDRNEIEVGVCGN
jgi:hypothetical protein